MRAFNTIQQEQFLNAFGQQISTINGVTFTGIVDVRPIIIEGTNVVEGEEMFITTKKVLLDTINYDSIIIIDDVEMEVYNIRDDLSGMIEIYVRNKESADYAGY